MLKNVDRDGNWIGLVTTAEETADVANALERVPEFALDLETTSLDPNKGVIHGIALATADQEWYVTLGAEHQMIEHLKLLVPDRQVDIHNAAFDLRFLKRRGLWVPRAFDTMVAQSLVNENQKLGLKSLAHTKLGVEEDTPEFRHLQHWAKRLLGIKKLEDVTIYDIPLYKLAEYAARDTRLGFDLAQVSSYELEQEEMWKHFWDIEMPFMYILMSLEDAGFYIDQDLLAQLDRDFSAKRDEALQRFHEITGGVNPASDKQLAEYFYGVMKYKPTKFTETNNPSVDVMSMKRLLSKDKNGAVAALLEYRKYEKLIGTYITSFQDRLLNGYLYGNFNQTGTVTGRLSSSNPNLQNIPSRGELGAMVRSLFIAPFGYLFLDADYSALEMRILAHYTRDERLMKVLIEGGDPHQLTVDLITNLGYTITRRDAKSVNFGWAYGIGPRGLQDSVEEASGHRPDETDTRNWLNGFEKAYPGASKWKRRVIEYARDLGFVRTIAGRKRRLPEIRSNDRSLSGAAERQAINSIIQGSAADITKMAMLRIFPLLGDYGATMVAQVHDEICFYTPDSPAVEEFKQVVKREMEGVGEQYNMRLPLVAEPHAGPNWASTH